MRPPVLRRDSKHNYGNSCWKVLDGKQVVWRRRARKSLTRLALSSTTLGSVHFNHDRACFWTLHSDQKKKKLFSRSQINNVGIQFISIVEMKNKIQRKNKRKRIKKMKEKRRRKEQRVCFSPKNQRVKQRMNFIKLSWIICPHEDALRRCGRYIYVPW